MSDTLAALRRVRHSLKEVAELADREERTAALVLHELALCSPDELLTSIGGHGVAARFRASLPGKRILLRAELDALPVDTDLGASVAHTCGHDGHMAMLLGVAAQLKAQPPERGEVVLLFQPAEETGAGMARVLADPVFDCLWPDMAFALHNLPGHPTGELLVRDGPFAAASVGLDIRLRGHSAHAGEPQQARSPTPAVASLLHGLSALPSHVTALHEVALVTVIHARLGERAFGTTPGEAELAATLRTHDSEVMVRLKAGAVDLVAAIAHAYQLEQEHSWLEEFPATYNAPEANRIASAAGLEAGLTVRQLVSPCAWSEDFGHLAARLPCALLGLGAGESQPSLHHPDYDFPDEILPHGLAVWLAILRQVCG